MTEAEYLEAMSVVIKHNDGEPVDLVVYGLSKNLSFAELLQRAKDDGILNSEVTDPDAYQLHKEAYVSLVVLHLFERSPIQLLGNISKFVQDFIGIHPSVLQSILDVMCKQGMLSYSKSSNHYIRTQLSKKKWRFGRERFKKEIPSTVPPLSCDKCGLPGHAGRILHTYVQTGPLGEGSFCGDCLAKGVQLIEQPTVEKPAPLANNHAWATPCYEWP
jgi:hypothetical protein